MAVKVWLKLGPWYKEAGRYNMVETGQGSTNMVTIKNQIMKRGYAITKKCIFIYEQFSIQFRKKWMNESLVLSLFTYAWSLKIDPITW